MSFSSHGAGASPSHCPFCGSPLPMEARFCGSCGNVLTSQVQSPPQPGAGPVVQTPQMPAAAAPQAQVPQPKPVHNNARTMIGMVMPPGALPPSPSQGPVLQSPSPAAAPSAPGAAPAPVKNANKTMVGMVFQPPSPVASPAQPEAPKAPNVAQVANANKTMMGMILQPPGAPAAAPASQPMAMMPQAMAPQPQSPPLTPGGGVSRPRVEQPPMLGVAVVAPRNSEDDVYVPGLSKPRKKGGSNTGLLIVGIAGVAAVLGAGVYFGLGMRRGAAPPLVATVQVSPAGAPLLLVDVPGAVAGSRLRISGHEATIESGRATVSGVDLGDRVGPIDLPAELTSNGATTARTVRVVLAYQVRADLSGLAEASSTLRLRFSVPPGAKLFIDGQEVAVDQQSGRGVAALPGIPAVSDPTGRFQRRFEVRVQNADGSSVSGAYSVDVPRAPLALDRPAATSLVTSADSIVVHGHAPGATAVTVNGQPATMSGEEFTATAPLAVVGANAIEVRSSKQESVQASAQLEVTRVADSPAEITRYMGSAVSGAAAIARGAPATGTHVRLRGRALAVPRPFDGGITYQLLVTDPACPQGRCLVWVDAEPARTVAEGATVEVIGPVTGVRTSTNAARERRSDPVVYASFVR